MNLSQVLAFLAPLEPLFKAEALKLEVDGKAELLALVDKVSSPDLKLLLSALVGAVDLFAQQELAKLP